MAFSTTFALIVLVTLSTASSQIHSMDCLNSNDQKQAFDLDDHKECRDDQFGIAQNDTVRKVEKLLGLSEDQITFIGCDAAPFSTQMTDMEQPFHFQILYSTSGSQARQNCIAPLLHEIGHVYQLNKMGSREKLLESLRKSIQRVELGADFLAGVAAARLELNPGEFQRNLALAGSYDEKSVDAHGLPSDRTSAFRYGYFYEPKNASVEAQYSYFQRNLFGQIKHS